MPLPMPEISCRRDASAAIELTSRVDCSTASAALRELPLRQLSAPSISIRSAVSIRRRDIAALFMASELRDYYQRFARGHWQKHDERPSKRMDQRDGVKICDGIRQGYQAAI